MLSPEESYGGGDEGDSWKPPHMQQSGGPPHASKLNTWANKRIKGGHGGGMFPPGPDKGWPDGNRHTPSDQNKVPWSDPLQDQLLDSFCDDMFGMNIGGGKMGPPPNNGTHQWGRAEINQSTPWDIDSQRGGSFNDGLPGSGPRFMQPMNMDNNGTGQWRSWEHEAGGGFQKDFHHAGGFPPHIGGAGKMHGNFYNGAGANNFVMQQGFNERMNHGGPFVPPHQHPGAAPPHNKYGGNGRFQGYPQAAPMNVMPPSMLGRQPAFMPPPSLASAHPGVMNPGDDMKAQQRFNYMPPPQMHQIPPGGNFSTGNVGMVSIGTYQPNAPTAPPVNDDAVWHDPNGDLRKWQRDSGVLIWGDPSKQIGQPIRRWQQADENDSLPGQHSSTSSSNAHSTTQQQSPDLKKTSDEEEAIETGWGDLPPLNGGPISHAPSAGSGSQMGVGNTPGWMMGSVSHQQPQQIAQNPNAPPSGPAWSDPQRSMASNMPPSTHTPGTFYNKPAPGPGTPTDWSRQIHIGNDPSAGSTNEIADKLRMAATKGWIDPAVFCSTNNKLSTQTASLLNTLINRLTVSEQNNAKIEQLKRQESSGSSSANGSPQRVELDRLIRENAQITKELNDLRDKIHTSVEGQRSNRGMSLADELSNMSTMPASLGDVPLW